MNIYTLTLDANRTEIGSRSGGHNTTTSTILNGRTTVKSTGVDVLSFDLSVRLDGDRRITRQADALESLANNPTISVLPVGGCTHVGFDGYYVPSSTTRDPVLAEPRDGDPSAPDAIESETISLERAGTRNTHRIGVSSSKVQVDHPFGNETTARIGIPAGATLVETVDAISQPSQRESPTPVATVQAEHGAVDLYDIDAGPIDAPVYLYDLPYDPQGDVDAGVWDTYDHPTILDEDYVVAWGRVFDPSHEFAGEAVLENGLLRLRIDEPTNADETAALQVEQWGPNAADTQRGTGLYGEGLYGEGLYAGSRGAWVDVALPAYPDDVAADWQPLDVDLTRIGQARVSGQVVFEAVSADAGADAAEGDTYTVNVQLDRGMEDALVSIPSPGVQGPMPDALQSLLDPIASSRIVSPQVEQTLVARQEVRL